MLGHVYVVEDAKDLAQIVRDVTRYGGAYRPEVSRLRSCAPIATDLFYVECRIYMSSFNEELIGKRSRKQ